MTVRLVDRDVVRRWDSQSEAAAQKQYPSIDLVRLDHWYFGGVPGRVLDYGTGAAVNAIHLAKRGYTVEAIDASPEMVKVAKECVAQHPEIAERIGLRRLPVAATELPYDAASFDYIVCVSVLSLLGSRERIEALLSEFRRIMKPDAKIIADVNAASADFARDSEMLEDDVYLYKGRSGDGAGVRTYCPDSAEKFAKMMEKYFAIDDVGYTSFKYLHSSITEFIVCAHKKTD